jgi:predicted nucleic acid-binding protein
MTAVLVDSNVLLYIMTDDPRWFPWSAGAIERAADRSRLVINAVIYAEVSIRYSRIEDREAALPRTMLDREGEERRRSALPDFFIGAHVAVAGYRLMTRECGALPKLLSQLTLIAPD